MKGRIGGKNMRACDGDGDGVTAKDILHVWIFVRSSSSGSAKRPSVECRL